MQWSRKQCRQKLLAEEHKKFGAKDVTDLSWKNLLDAYTCTECGRCTEACPANQTGKMLSPSKIMMDTRDRMEELGNSVIKTELLQKMEKLCCMIILPLKNYGLAPVARLVCRFARC